MTPKSFPAATGGHKFTPEQYGRAFQTIRPGQLEAVLDMSLRSMARLYPYPPADGITDATFDALHHELLGTAELVKVLLIAHHPVIYGKPASETDDNPDSTTLGDDPPDAA